MKKFLPFAQKDLHHDVIAIDCYAKNAFNLSHWRGAPKIDTIHDDTSAQITLHAIENKLSEIEADYVTCNHFDIDGFLGIWSVFNPELALENRELIAEAALIGDFRELNDDKNLALEAIKLVCTINYLEQHHFYAPFAFKTREAQTCIEKFNYFLTHFSERFSNIQGYQKEWEKEFNLVIRHLEMFDQNNAKVCTENDLRLQIVETENPLHYYALFARSCECDMVLCLYNNNRYELECKYSTWVDTNRNSYPRIDLNFLAAKLNTMERSGLKWGADHFADTGPILRLDKEKLSKETRFDHPMNRPIYSSSIKPDLFQQTVVNFFRQVYSGIAPKKWWSWQEIEQINSDLQPILNSN